VLAFEAPHAEPRELTARAPTPIVISGAASFGPQGLLSGTASARYLSGSTESNAPADPLALLDPERSRRFGRASAMVVATAQAALVDSAHDAASTGFVVGSAFGDVDRSLRFLQKVLGQGPRFASPAEFPQLIASTGSGNASIYLGLRGPCLSVSEFGTSGESALSVAISLLELGLAKAMLAGSAEARDPIVDAVLGPARGVPRAEGGGFVLLEGLPEALARGQLPLAVVREHRAWRGDPTPEFAALSAPPTLACVVVGSLTSAVRGALARSAWRAAAVHELPEKIGYHEALGATALAVGVAELATGRAEQVLVVTSDVDTVYLTRLERYEIST
jgi:3-oxoacyl-[acyl-carrier-protein] synthase II